SLIVVEAAYAVAIVERVGATPGAVDDVMVVQVLARGAAGGGTAPAGAGVDRVSVALRGGGRYTGRNVGGCIGRVFGRGVCSVVRCTPAYDAADRVPGEDKVFQESQEADPAGDAAGADGKRPGCEHGRRGMGIRPRLVPGDRVGQNRQALPG